jgi:hypothetical protein
MVTASPEAAAEPLPPADDVELDALSLPEEHAVSSSAAAIAVAAIALRMAVRGDVFMSWLDLS